MVGNTWPQKQETESHIAYLVREHRAMNVSNSLSPSYSAYEFISWIVSHLN